MELNWPSTRIRPFTLIFNHQRRELYLSHGEILVTNSHHTTPLHVATSQGRVRPIGTRFCCARV
ncbi:FecR domain-containing protein [Vibrio sinaloensis]|nr:FecR domain-containing protein [Vibrio sinaloensis]